MRDDEGPLVPRGRAETIAEGVRLGLPRDWVEALPKIEELPGEYDEQQVEGDAFLVWNLTTHQFLSDRAESARRVAFRGLGVGWTWGDAWRVGSRRSRRRSRRTCAGVCPGSTESSARAWPC